MKNKTFFFVTTVREYIDNKKHKLHDTRCIGFYPSIKGARNILKNGLDEAGYFQYAVIEEFGFGWYPWEPNGVEEWYKFDPKRKAIKITKPKKWKNVVGWGIG